MTSNRKEQGVSLVELVMAVAIALIIVAVGVPTFLSTLRNYRVNGDARDIAAEILLAKCARHRISPRPAPVSI